MLDAGISANYHMKNILITHNHSDHIASLPFHLYNTTNNNNITIEIIEQYPDKRWNWDSISCNPNITMEFINKYPDKPWDWYNISYNKFTKDKNEFILHEYKKHLASFKIQQWYHYIRMNPEYKFCRKRVNDFYDKVIQMEI